MHTLYTRIASLAMAATCLAGAAAGQAQVQPVRRGNALDANYQVGSGGSNYSYVPNNYAPASTSIYAATRTRGLSGFRGGAAALSGDFQGQLGTDALSRFERQSVGVGDVMRGRVYNPQSSVYYDPYRRTLTPRTVSRAAEVGIAPVPGEVSSTLGVAQKLFVDATADYGPVMNEPDDVYVDQALAFAATEGNDLVEPGLPGARLDAMDLADRAGPEMFGVLRTDERAKLADELKRLREARMGEADEADQRLQGAVDTQVQPQGADLVARQVGEELRGPQRPEPLKLPGEGELAEDGDELARPDDLVNRRRGEQNLPEADADVFLDVLLAIREKQALEASDRPSDDESALPEIDRRDPVQSMIDRRVERTKDNRVVIHRLEGKTPSTFNDFMKQGREALRQGRFYRAARQYELAAMNRPRNPLPFVGRGLSAFASGEYHTAAVNLRRALELFPALMETQLDFNTLLPTRGFDLHTQMHHLEQWMAQIQARQPVRFLATFIYHNQGKNELAKHHAEAIVNADGAVDPIYKAYAQYVLTGKKPAELIENAPGKNPADAPTEGK